MKITLGICIFALLGGTVLAAGGKARLQWDVEARPVDESVRPRSSRAEG